MMESDFLLTLAEDSFIIISNRQNYATLTYTCTLWDFAEMMFILHYLRPGDLFLDIGANVGGYSILASAVAGARSIAFEPVPATYSGLVRNIRANGIAELVDTRMTALGDQTGSISMTADRGGLNHVLGPHSASQGIEVEMLRLDEVLSGRDCHVMKLDAEGYELAVLRGADKTLANPLLRALIVELNGSGIRYGHSDETVHDLITQYGFTPHRYDPFSRLLSPLPTFNRSEMNTLYVRDAATIANTLSAGRRIRIRAEEI